MPVAVLDQPVMVCRTAAPRWPGRWSAGRPWPDVVGFAPAGRPVAAGKGAAAVAQDERPAQRSGEQPPGPADVEDLAAAAEHRRDDGGVAGEPAGGAGRDRGAVVEGRAARPSRRTASGTVTTTCGRSPPVSGSVPPARTRRQTSTSASARRRPAGRGSGPSAAAGRGGPADPAPPAPPPPPPGSSRPRSQAPPSPSGVKDRSIRRAARSGPRQRVALAGVDALRIGHREQPPTQPAQHHRVERAGVRQQVALRLPPQLRVRGQLGHRPGDRHRVPQAQPARRAGPRRLRQLARSARPVFT